MTRRRWLMFALGAAAVLLILGRVLAGVYTNYLWYDSLGATAVWRARLGALAVLRVSSAVVAAAFAFVNFYAVRQSVVSLVFPRRLANLEIGEEVPGRILVGVAVALALIVGIALAVPQTDWTTVVLAGSGRMFYETDPYFQVDLGFFVYWLPFENMLWTWAFVVLIVVLVIVVLIYALTPSLKLHRGSVYASAYVRRHLTVLVGVLLLMLAWSFRLDMYSLVVDGGGPDGAFTFADHRVGVIGDLVLALVTFGAAVIVIWSGYIGQLRLAGISVLTVIGLSLLVREVAPVAVDHFGPDAMRAARERPYLETRAGYSRRAYAADAVVLTDSTIAYPSLGAAIPWLPFWDPPALTRAIDNGRAADSQSVPIAWRSSAAGLVADVVDPPPLGASLRAPWTINRVLAASADDRGSPIHALSAGTSESGDMLLDAPLVYAGAPSVAIVSDSLSHIAGTSLEPFLSRLANAWSQQNLRLLSTDLPQPHPTIVSHRDVRDRLGLVAPFFAQGRAVNPVLVGDSLYWSLDLYSASATYPMAQHALIAREDRTYWHHAAVAVVQATTGDVVIVPDSVLDPIASTWTHRLPSLFGTWSALPAGIRTVLAPPIDGLYAQAAAFARYGSRTANEPARHVPVFNGADSALSADDVPIVLPGAKSTALAIPLVDEAERVRGLLIGLGGGTRKTLWYPLTTPGPRWSVVLDRLRALDSAGSAVHDGGVAHGRVRAVPIRSGIGFVQPTYRWRPQSVPTLSRVALLADDTARAIAPSAAPASRGVEAPIIAGDLKTSVTALYAAMRDALRRGDWAAFGRAFDALGRVLGPQRAP
jgi:uncharacterized membrane protein (UPF0182 family)